ncbi:MAG: hypothetical protein AAF387_18320, partial [Pseudomonadota bacterium]
MSSPTKRVPQFFKATFWLILALAVIGFTILQVLRAQDGVMMLYHMRIPIIATLIIMVLPILTLRSAGIKQMLRNLFVLTSTTQVAAVVVGAVVYGSAIVLVLDIIWQAGPIRFGYVNPTFFQGWNIPF